jgi:hypothetical protein
MKKIALFLLCVALLAACGQSQRANDNNGRPVPDRDRVDQNEQADLTDQVEASRECWTDSDCATGFSCHVPSGQCIKYADGDTDSADTTDATDTVETVDNDEQDIVFCTSVSQCPASPDACHVPECVLNQCILRWNSACNDADITETEAQAEVDETSETFVCTSDSQCNDGDNCTHDSCLQGECVHPRLAYCVPCVGDAQCLRYHACDGRYSIYFTGTCTSFGFCDHRELVLCSYVCDEMNGQCSAAPEVDTDEVEAEVEVDETTEADAEIEVESEAASSCRVSADCPPSPCHWFDCVNSVCVSHDFDVCYTCGQTGDASCQAHGAVCVGNIRAYTTGVCTSNNQCELSWEVCTYGCDAGFCKTSPPEPVEPEPDVDNVETEAEESVEGETDEASGQTVTCIFGLCPQGQDVIVWVDGREEHHACGVPVTLLVRDMCIWGRPAFRFNSSNYNTLLSVSCPLTPPVSVTAVNGTQQEALFGFSCWN